MADILTEIRQVLEEVVYPELKLHTARLDELRQQSALQHQELMQAIENFRLEMRAEFAALRADHHEDSLRQQPPVTKRVQ